MPLTPNLARIIAEMIDAKLDAESSATFVGSDLSNGRTLPARVTAVGERAAAASPPRDREVDPAPLDNRPRTACRSRTPRSPRTALQAVVVQMTEVECDDFDGWLRRATAAGDSKERLTKFATWYPPVARRWFDAAADGGLWESIGEPSRVAGEYCRRASEALAHAQRADRLIVHFVVDADQRPYVFRARWCREAPEIPFTRRWTDDQQLTWEEFNSGKPCRGCGRGFVGGPEWKPILQRTPAEAAEIQREETAFRALHRNCPRMSWRVGNSGLTHCCECCPRPPLSPQQVKEITRILLGIGQQHKQDELDLHRRWRATSE